MKAPAWSLPAALCVLVWACGSDDAPARSPSGDAGATETGTGGTGSVIGAAGGKLVSADGRLTLTVPPGALTKDERLSVDAVDKSPGALRGASRVAAYRFAPDGLTFAVPAQVTYAAPDAVTIKGADANVPLLVATSYSADKLSRLEKQELSVDLDKASATLATEIAHFSDLVVNTLDPDVTSATNPHFSVVVQPMPPASSEVSVPYNVALRMRVRQVWNGAVPITYDDESTALTFSGGGNEIPLVTLEGNSGTDFDKLVPIGQYTCPAAGDAKYEAIVRTGIFPAILLPADYECSDDPNAKCVSAGPMKYLIRLARKVVCVPKGTTPPPTDSGAPYGAYVEHGRAVTYDGNLGAAGSGGSKTGTLSAARGLFLAPGGDQAAFDAWVVRRRRMYGFMPNRGAVGTCRLVNQTDYADAVPGLAGTGHVGSGVDDAIALDFLVPPTVPRMNVPWVVNQNAYALSTKTALPAVTPTGIDVFVPASAGTASLRLPGFDESKAGKFIVQTSLAAGDTTITWQADQVPNDALHVWLVSSTKVAECFVEPSLQLLTVPQSFMATLCDPPTNQSLFAGIYSGKRTEAKYDNRTFEGISAFVQETMFMPPPGN